MKDILIRKNGHVGHITLNRPKALNALTYDMILEIEKALISWKENTKIKLILVDSNGDKAFCSGGDVSIYTDMEFLETINLENYSGLMSTG